MRENSIAEDAVEDEVEEAGVASEEKSYLTEQSSLVVEAGEAARLDKFLASRLTHVSREKIKQAILARQCAVDGEVNAEPKVKVRTGQQVVLSLEQEVSTVEPVPMELDIYYKDANLAVLNKPTGLTVHPCPSCKEITLVHGLLHTFPELTEQGGLRPGIVHRLDKDTSGLMVVALNEGTRLKLSQAFAERQVHKTYLALVHGVPPKEGECTAPIGRHPTQKIKMAVVQNGREAHTSWKVLYSEPNGAFALVAVTIHTGRTHQIRVHMTHMGHPLVGDTVYALPQRYKAVEGVQRQMLHAWRLELPVNILSTGGESDQIGSSPFAADCPVSHETMGCVEKGRVARKIESKQSAENSLRAFVCPPPQDYINTALRLFVQPVRAVITGCPGCGKSAVLDCLEEMGCTTCSADALVRKLYESNASLKKHMVSRFGKDILFSGEDVETQTKSEYIIRSKLFAKMVEDECAKLDVDRIIHPYVFEEINSFFVAQPTGVLPVLVAEIPLWFESNTRGDFSIDAVIGVDCPDAHRHGRLRDIRQWNEILITTMDSWQMPQCDKMRRCTHIIKNDGTYEQLYERAVQLCDMLLTLPREKTSQLLTLMGVSNQK